MFRRKRFGYPIEFWLNLGKRRPTNIRCLGPSTPIPNSLILPSDFPRRYTKGPTR